MWLKKGTPFFIGALLFLSTLFYLHQKVLIFVEAYKLNKNYRIYNDLVDKRDNLRYNLAKKISIVKINQWAEVNNFSFVGKERVLALNLKRNQSPISKNKFTRLFTRFLKVPAQTSEALAEERR
jgi:hypothetical protein